VNIFKVLGFTGFRSVFQWTVGKSINNTNYGIENAMRFTANDSISKQIVGNIGLYSNGSQIGVQLSLDTVQGSPNPTFNCSKNFPFNNKTRACFNSSYSLISNAIYYLDVEIRNKTISGYISQPQTNLSTITNSTLPRILIGEINWSNNLNNLNPDSYWIANSYKSCNVSSEITTYNYIPEIYNKDKRQRASYSGSILYNSRMCGPLNTLALTDWNTIVYISRPSVVINGTRLMNH